MIKWIKSLFRKKEPDTWFSDFNITYTTISPALKVRSLSFSINKDIDRDYIDGIYLKVEK